MANTSIARTLKQAQGGNDGTWGGIQTEANELIEQAFGGVSSVEHNDAVSMTLTANDQTVVSGAANDQSRAAVIVVTGTTTDQREVVLPDSEKTYLVANQTTNALRFKAGAGTVVDIPSGASTIIWTDGDGNAARGVNWVSTLRIGNATVDALEQSGGTLNVRADTAVSIRTDDLTHRDATGTILKATRHTTEGPSLQLGDQTLTHTDFRNLDAATTAGIVTKPNEVVTLGGAGTVGQLQIADTTGEDGVVSIVPNRHGASRGIFNIATDSTGGMITIEQLDNSGTPTYVGSIEMNDDGDDLVFRNSTGSVSLTRLIQLGNA